MWPEFITPEVESRDPGAGCGRCVCGEWIMAGVKDCARCGVARNDRY